MNREQTIEMGRLMIDFAAGEAEVEMRRINFIAEGKWICMGAPAIWNCDVFEYRRKPNQKEVWGFRGKDGFDYRRLFHSKEAAILEYKDKVGDAVRYVEADPQ